MKHQEFYQRLNLATRLLDDLDETATIRGVDLKAPFLSNGMVVISLSDKPAHLTNHETITIPFADGTGFVESYFYPALTENGIVAGYITLNHTDKETT